MLDREKLCKKLNKRFIPKMPTSWKKINMNGYLIMILNMLWNNIIINMKIFFLWTFYVDCPEEITCPLTNLSAEMLINRMGKTKFATIYNLDKHNGLGLIGLLYILI